VPEPAQEFRVIVRPDHTPLLAVAWLRPSEPPTDVDQTCQDEQQDQIRHAKNLLVLNIRVVGRLGLVSERRPVAHLVLDVAVYTLARLLLVAILTAVIFGAGHLLGIEQFPLVVAVLFAIVIALPTGIWLLAPLRRRATASIAVFDERRRRDREQLQARLRGDDQAS
jgi:hypothetical protein